jgi:hypothetical protein
LLSVDFSSCFNLTDSSLFPIYFPKEFKKKFLGLEGKYSRRSTLCVCRMNCVWPFCLYTAPSSGAPAPIPLWPSPHPPRDDLRLHFSLARPQFVTENVAKVRFDGRWAEVNKGSESTRIHTHTTQLLRYFLCKQPRRAADSTRVFLAHYRR